MNGGLDLIAGLDLDLFIGLGLDLLLVNLGPLRLDFESDILRCLDVLDDLDLDFLDKFEFRSLSGLIKCLVGLSLTFGLEFSDGQTVLKRPQCSGLWCSGASFPSQTSLDLTSSVFPLVLVKEMHIMMLPPPCCTLGDFVWTQVLLWFYRDWM